MPAVLFDLDDTLFDHHHASIHGVRAIKSHYEIFSEIPFDNLFAVYSEILETYHLKLLSGENTQDETRTLRMQALFAHYGTPPDDKDCFAAFEIYRDGYWKERHPIQGATELLRELHGKVSLGIITNNVASEQIPKLKFLKMDHFFDTIIISGDTGCSKPDPRIFDPALKELAMEPKDVIMVGDSWSSDIVGALNANIRPIWFNRFGKIMPQDAFGVLEIRELTPAKVVSEMLLGHGDFTGKAG